MAVNTSFGRLWPHCDARRHLVVVRAPVSGARIPVHAGIAPLVAEGLRRMELGVGGPAYVLDPNQCGGFNCRRIADTDSPSNHSGGLAFDLDWLLNPFKKGARYKMPAWVWRMWESIGFYWGGRYHDYMHFEWLKTPTAAAAAVKRLLSGGRSVGAGEATLRPGSTGDAVRRLQEAMALKVDGHYGPATEAKVREFQRSRGLTDDGIYGPATRAALEDDMPITDADVNKIAGAAAALVWKWTLKGEKPYTPEDHAWRMIRETRDLVKATESQQKQRDERIIGLLEQILAALPKAG